MISRLAAIPIVGLPVSTVGTATSTLVSVDVSTLLPIGALNNCGFHVRGTLVGIDGSNNVVSAEVARAFKRISGTLSALGAGVTVIAAVAGDAAITAAVAGLVASGNSIQLQVTGVLATTITWNGTLFLTSSDFTT